MQNKVGDEVLSYCGKCKLALGHVIMAMEGQKMVKLRCNTCQAVHGYKSPNQKRVAPKKAKQVKAEVTIKDHQEFYNQHMQRLASKSDVPYTTSKIFQKDDVIKHKTFGTGFVHKVVSADKIEVVFEPGVKLLVHGIS